tara:strand:+ start:1350 stop:3089 length:1740 start_codon:yes stop_codon:yes gene_type:complete
VEVITQPIKALQEALVICRRSFIAVGVFSFFINFLMLTPVFYMINVFDKAVATNSVPTLVALAVIALLMYLVLGLLEWLRSVVLIHIGSRLDVILAPRIYALCFRAESGNLNLRAGGQPLADLSALRQFLATPTAAVIFDLPWIPLFLVLMYLFHPSLAILAFICMVIMGVLAFANQRASTSGLQEANRLSGGIATQTQRNLRNAEVAAAMGMMAPLTQRWRQNQNEMLEVQSAASGTASGYAATIKVLAVVMQSAAITTGAVLAMAQEISPGVVIGAALLLGKTLQPVQQGVSSWKSFVDAREQYHRLNDLLASFPPEGEKMSLPSIEGRIMAHQVVVIPPGAETPTVKNVSFSLVPGTITMILGPSAAGKSTLVRALLGLWPTASGVVRIDGSEAQYCNREELGPQIGYLPQDIELFDGSVADNIARFGDLDPDLVIRAAQDADVHQMILGLPEGYDTVITGSQGLLSPGQRQRIALARALYGRPKLLILDEPNSNLDELGERALNQSIARMKEQGSTVIMVSHRQSSLSLADYVIILDAGQITDAGPREEVVERAQARHQAQQARVQASTPTAAES